MEFRHELEPSEKRAAETTLVQRRSKDGALQEEVWHALYHCGRQESHMAFPRRPREQRNASNSRRDM